VARQAGRRAAPVQAGSRAQPCRCRRRGLTAAALHANQAARSTAQETPRHSSRGAAERRLRSLLEAGVVPGRVARPAEASPVS
jgi:hypothetical protein